MRIAICDDNVIEQEQLVKTLRCWDSTCFPECFISGARLLETSKQKPQFDIAFLDVYMPEENGVEIASELKKISPETQIVFVTTSCEHAI